MSDPTMSPAPAEAPLDLEPYYRRIEELKAEGAKHVEAWKEDADHADGPAVECVGCDDLFGLACALQDIVAEVERLRATPYVLVKHVTDENVSAHHALDRLDVPTVGNKGWTLGLADRITWLRDNLRARSPC